MNTKVHYVFDLDGTIFLKDEKISEANHNALLSIPDRVLNTSRCYEEIPSSILGIFSKVMTLNGGCFYENGQKIYEFEPLDLNEVQTIVQLARKHNYNISFNNTRSFFQNVTNKVSTEFMQARAIKFFDEIIDIPHPVFLIAISHHEKVCDEHLREIQPLNFYRQSPRFVEFCRSSKANIGHIFPNFLAFGDNANDFPMFKKAQKYWIINQDFPFSDNWISLIVKRNFHK